MSSQNNTNGDKEQFPFFFYGTLRHDQENYMLLRGRTVSEQAAQISDMELYSLKTYPVMVGGVGTVHGELMWLYPRFYHEMVAEFDQLEGYQPTDPEAGLFRRVLLTVCAESGLQVRAWAYLGNDSLLETFSFRVKVPEGDWVAYRNRLIMGTRFGRFILGKHKD